MSRILPDNTVDGTVVWGLTDESKLNNTEITATFCPTSDEAAAALKQVTEAGWWFFNESTSTWLAGLQRFDGAYCMAMYIDYDGIGPRVAGLYPVSVSTTVGTFTSQLLVAAPLPPALDAPVPGTLWLSTYSALRFAASSSLGQDLPIPLDILLQDTAAGISLRISEQMAEGQLSAGVWEEQAQAGFEFWSANEAWKDYEWVNLLKAAPNATFDLAHIESDGRVSQVALTSVTSAQAVQATLTLPVWPAGSEFARNRLEEFVFVLDDNLIYAIGRGCDNSRIYYPMGSPGQVSFEGYGYNNPPAEVEVQGYWETPAQPLSFSRVARHKSVASLSGVEVSALMHTFPEGHEPVLRLSVGGGVSGLGPISPTPIGQRGIGLQSPVV